jgi:CheY-like chemotaxis protein
VMATATKLPGRRGLEPAAGSSSAALILKISRPSWREVKNGESELCHRGLFGDIRISCYVMRIVEVSATERQAPFSDQGKRELPLQEWKSQRMSVPNKERRKVLLVVEDDILIAGMISDQLSELGYLVAGPAHSLEEGKRLANDAPLDGALINVKLGKGLSGPIADILIEREVPILFVTGYYEVPDARFRHIPVLPKPFTMEHLRRAIENMLSPTVGYRKTE